MITINKTPPETFFAGNPALYKIYSDNMLSVAGVKCNFSLVVYASDTTTGHTLTFEFPDKTITFITALVPDDSGNQIPTADTPTNWLNWAERLFECLQSNFELSQRFIISIAPPDATCREISFMAVKTGLLHSAVVTSNLVTVTKEHYHAGIEDTARTNFAIIGGVWDSNFRQLVQDAKSVDGSGNVVFNFSEYLSAMLDYDQTPHFTFPFDPDNNLKVFTNFVLPYYAGFAERFDGKIQKIHFDALRHAIPGGLNRETLVLYNSQEEDFFGVSENSKCFMTWAPLVKVTGKTVPEKLFFYIPKDSLVTAIELVVKVIYTTGSFDTVHFGSFPVLPNQVIECSVGYEQLDLATVDPAKTVASWQVNLDNFQTGVLSEVRTFMLDAVTYENERIFIFQNSFGRAYDVVRFTGKGSMNIDLDFTVNSCTTLEMESFFNASSRKSLTSEMQKMVTNSGWISRQMKDYLREMLLSRQVFEYKDNLLYPIVITTNVVKEHFIDDKYLYSLDLEYDRAYRDFFFQ